jgi:hypothetical protein
MSELDTFRWHELEERGVFGPQLGALYRTIPRLTDETLSRQEHKAAFLYALERLMKEGRLLVDLRVDPKHLPWGAVQTEIIEWFSANLPSEEVLEDGLWWIDNFSRPDSWYPGACVWHAASMTGGDIWA